MTADERATLSCLAGSWEILGASPNVVSFARSAYRLAASELRATLDALAAPPPADELRKDLETP